MRNGLACIFMLTLSAIVFAQEHKSAIYTLDGSIIIGSIVSQDFSTNIYRIEMENGEVKSIPQERISKIIYNLSNVEANAIPNGIPQIIPDTVSNTVHSSPATEKSKATPPARSHPQPREWTIGLVRHVVQHEHQQYYNYTLKEEFNGIRVSYRKVPKSALSLKMDLELAFENHTESVFDAQEKDYASISAYITLGKQHENGWQAYIGAGPFIGHYWMQEDRHINIGLLTTAAFGYQHRNLSALLSGRYYHGTLTSGASSLHIDKIYSLSLDFAFKY